MRIAYFDCYSGISGDMTIASFLDAGLDINTLRRELSGLKIKGYEIRSQKVKRNGLAGTSFVCITPKGIRHHRTLKEIQAIIDKSSLERKVKRLSKNIFDSIASAEAAVHGTAKKDVHLHEVGAIDSIIDIVGTAIAIDKLGIDEIYSSNITMGRTILSCEHGSIPIPGPASLELLRGVPVEISDIKAELVTPTGAGIIKAVSKGFGRMPMLKIDRIGYGAGTKELHEVPNMLRVVIGERESSFREDNIFVIETNIDDMNPQNFEYLFEKLFSGGALEAYTEPIQMKKSRPAFKLTVLSEPGKVKELSTVIFRETTSIGIRYHEVNRYKLDRRFVKAKTKYGDISVKLSSGPDDIMTATPEYDECAKLARQKGVPLKKVYEEAKAAVRV